MAKYFFRSFHVLSILTVLISQFGLIPSAAAEVEAAPAAYVVPASPSFAGTTISNVRLNAGGNIAFVSPGSILSVSMDYSIVDTVCPGCIDEIEIGFSTENPFTCIYTGIPGVEGDSGSATIEVTAPSVPGVYFLGFDRAQHYSCGQALERGWWSGAPDPNRYIANIIVTTLIVNSTADTNDETCDANNCTLREAINAANFNEGLDLVAFDIPSEGTNIIAPDSALPAITDPIIVDGYTQPGANPNTLATGNNASILVELDGDSCDGCGQALLISSGGSTIRGLAIHGNFNNGIEVNGSGSTIAGNFFGLRADGTAHGVLASGVYVNNTTDNTIGGTTPADRNVISANRDGIFIAAGGGDSTNNLISGNYIGTDPAGTAAIGNRQRGIFVGTFGRIATNNTITDNLISGNGHFGVLLRDSNVTGNFVLGNRVGLNADGTAALPNGGSESGDDGLAGTNARAGVYIAGSNNAVGGTTKGAGNTIAFNRGAGVNVASGAGNAILGNSIFSNDNLGIDLGGDEVTFNHVGLIAGPNNYQNYPVLTVATSDGGMTRVGGTLESEANKTYSIDVFANDSCDPTFFGEGKIYLGSFWVTTNDQGFATFDVEIEATVNEPIGITTTATEIVGEVPASTSEFSYCRPVSTSNLNWMQAQSVSEVSQTQQFITDIFQEKWFKFSVQPDSTVSIKLTSLPGSAVSLHRDPHPIYDALIDPQNGTLLSAEAADAAFLPSGSLPSGSLPSGSLPSGSLPSGSLPSGSLPTGYLPSGSLPSGSLPSGSLPSGSLPSGSLPSGSLPSGSLPSGSLPSGSLPSGSLPSGSLPSGSLPSGSLPSGSLPGAYATAARNSLMGIAMDPYATVQTIERNTYDLQEDLYVRVVGPYNLETPFTLEVTVTGGVCGDVQAVPPEDQLPVISGTPFTAGSHKTLILTDTSPNRLQGTTAEVDAALLKLQELKDRPEVEGEILNFADANYPRVAFANAEADAHVGCAAAKNMVAKEIKKVVDKYREANPTLEYIVLAGGANVIPFFQVQDVSGLANEKDYVPPVAPSTASEASLKTNLVQGQDAYGSQVDFTQAGFTLALPDLAVGRLVDTATDISAAVAAYIATDGSITPNSALVTGYDFVGDAAEAVKVELDAGTNSTADALIQPPGEPPTGPNAWTAGQLRTKLQGSNFDIAVLTGHFSAGGLLAADYATQLSAAELTSPQFSYDLTDTLVLALGCHGGYSIPNNDLLTGISPQPDWAKAFLRKGAAGYISATGYAYGDTELKEYGERLFILVAQQLRTGSGPVSVGQALVKAKQQYLAETTQLSGIDQKTLVEMALYGLPMMTVNMPGARLSVSSYPSKVNGTDPVPGANFGLSRAVVPLTSSDLATTTHPKDLEDLSTETQSDTIKAFYLSGNSGVVANPFEPIYPKAIYDVSANDHELRGVALRGGSYSDITQIDTKPFIPLTSSPTTETSTAHLSYNTDVFYPTQLWAPNYYDALDGSGKTRLILFPAQFKSSAPGAIDGTLRKFDELNLQLYYLPDNWADASSPASLKAAAVSAAPNIQGVSAVMDGSNMKFSANVVAEGSAGVQAVWVLYTGKPGSPYHGIWTPLDLTKNGNDPTLWEGSFQPNGNAEDILFMVQAVGGAGLTALATNLGAYYSLTPPTPPQPPVATILTLQSPPADGTYLKESTFHALLESGGQPLPDQFVTLDIGGQQTFAFTNASGVAELKLKLVIRPDPDPYTAEVRFRGNADYLGSNDTSAFTVQKDTTTLAVTPASASVPTSQPTPFVAVVRDSSGRALGGKSVFFIVHNSMNTFATSVIADYQGNAALGTVPLPAGTYTVDAYFNGTIPLNPAITLSDDYYESSSRLGLSLELKSFAFTGFFDPVKNPPVINQMKAGQAVPIKFSLGGDQGLAIFAAGFPKSRELKCESLDPIDPVDQTITAGSSSLTYDPATGVYTYVWKTEKTWANTCRQFSVQFIDGKTYTLLFKFVR